MVSTRFKYIATDEKDIRGWPRMSVKTKVPIIEDGLFKGERDGCIVYTNDHFKMEGYVEVTEMDVAFVQEKTGKPWGELVEVLTNELVEVTTKALKKMEDNDAIYRMKLFHAAEMHKKDRYANNKIPDIIATYADTNELTGKQASREILEKQLEFNNRLTEIQQVRLYGMDDYKRMDMAGLIDKHKEFIAHVNDISNFFL